MIGSERGGHGRFFFSACVFFFFLQGVRRYVLS